MQKPPKRKRLLTRVREAIRLKHYSYRTEKTYVQWSCRYILFDSEAPNSHQFWRREIKLVAVSSPTAMTIP